MPSQCQPQESQDSGTEAGLVPQPTHWQHAAHHLTTVLPPQDPYFMKNHLGSYECKLCLTLHNNEVRPIPPQPPSCPTRHHSLEWISMRRSQGVLGCEVWLVWL